MLRAGHLTTMAAAAQREGGSWRRVIAETAEMLVSPTAVDPRSHASLAYYLGKKRFCPQGENSGMTAEDREKYRYPDFVLSENADGCIEVSRREEAESLEELEVWWQDACLVAPDVRSRVGAVTVSAKRGSKTSLSHIQDWAQLLDILTKNGELSVRGRLIARALSPTDPSMPRPNPYVLGGEKVVLASAFLHADFDLFSRLVIELGGMKGPIKKKEMQVLFAGIIRRIDEEVEQNRRLSSNQRFDLFEHLRDLEKAGDKARKPIEEISTTWHRVSSRLEFLVDIGLLDKGKGGEDEKYAYVYYPNEKLKGCVETMEGCSGGREWIEKYLVEVLTGSQCVPLSNDSDDLARSLLSVAKSLKLASSVLPLDELAEGIAWAELERGRPVSIGSVREGLVELVRTRPELARLERGREGQRAEFISLDFRKLRDVS